MYMKNILTITVIGIVILIGGFFALNSYIQYAERGPDDAEHNNTQTLPLRVGELGNGLGIALSPIEILEDSRCPTDVTCIQAGTVRVRTLMSGGNSDGEHTLTLSTPLSLGDFSVTLTEVFPEANSEIPLRPQDYVLTFTITKNQ